MTAKEKLENISKILFGAGVDTVPPVPPAPAPPAPQKMATDYPTKDGSVVLSIDELKVGSSVMINGQPAPDGEYVLADDTNVQVAGGVIAELSSPTGDSMPEEMKNMPAKMSAMEQAFAEHKAAFEAFKAENETLKQEFSAAKETIGKQDTAIKGLLEVVQQLAETPKENPAAKPESFRQDGKGRLDYLVTVLKDIKTNN